MFSLVTACQANRQAGDSAITGPGGIELVQLNEQNIWTKRKKYIQQAVLEADQGGQDALGQELAGDRFGVLATSLDGRAFGCDVPAAQKD